MAKLDLVFVCSKCEHDLYLTNGVNLTGKEIARKLKRSCPNCGEEVDEWDGLWTFVRLGNYDIEHPEEQNLSPLI